VSLADTRMIGVSINNLTGITGHSYGLDEMVRSRARSGIPGIRRSLGARCAFRPADHGLLRQCLHSCAIAGCTTILKLCTGILQPHLRNPVALALSWPPCTACPAGGPSWGSAPVRGKGTLVNRQYEALAALRHKTDLDPSAIYHDRGRLFVECLEIMNRLWREDKISHHGEFFQFDEVTLGEARPATRRPR